LNKIAQREAKRRPDCRVVAVNWGPWAGGMVSPALAKVFQREGVGLIPLKDGARFLLAELSDAGGPVEVVAGVWAADLASGPGAMPTALRGHDDANGADMPTQSRGHATPADQLTLVFEREISVE